MIWISLVILDDFARENVAERCTRKWRYGKCPNMREPNRRWCMTHLEEARATSKKYRGVFSQVERGRYILSAR